MTGSPPYASRRGPNEYPARSAGRRALSNRIFTVVCWIVAAASIVLLAILLITIARQGWAHLNLGFLRNVPSRNPAEAGLGPAMWGSVWVCAVCGLVALPLGVGTAIFLEEYKPRSRVVRKLHAFVQLNIANLAGVPSIVYGIIGLTVFVQAFDLFGNANEPRFEIGSVWYDQFIDESGQYLSVSIDGRSAPPAELRDGMAATDDFGHPVAIRVVSRDESTGETGQVLAGSEPFRFVEKSWYYLQLPFGRGVLAGGLTLMLVILPIVIISSQEALRAVPNSLRESALGMGATKWQMVWRMTLPAAVPGIMTGAILAMSRAIGEAAPILILAGIVFITFTPHHLMDDFTAMPLQVYDWASRPQDTFHEVAATGIIVLLAVLLTFNAAAVFIRQKFQKPLS